MRSCFLPAILDRVEDAEPEQVEAGASVHLSFEQLQSVDVAFDHAVLQGILSAASTEFWSRLSLRAKEASGESCAS